MHRLVIVSSLAITLVACATTPRPGLQAYQPVPSERVASSIAQIATDENPTHITLKRDPGVFGSLQYAYVRVAGRNLVVMHAGEYFELAMNAGLHTFEVGTILQRDIAPFIIAGPIGVALFRALDRKQSIDREPRDFERLTIQTEPGQRVSLRLFPRWFRGIQIELGDNGT